MEFAIFKFSTEKYSADEFFFPGAEHVDGTIEGAIRAGMDAYPVRVKDNYEKLKGLIFFFGSLFSK